MSSLARDDFEGLLTTVRSSAGELQMQKLEDPGGTGPEPKQISENTVQAAGWGWHSAHSLTLPPAAPPERRVFPRKSFQDRRHESLQLALDTLRSKVPSASPRPPTAGKVRLTEAAGLQLNRTSLVYQQLDSARVFNQAGRSSRLQIRSKSGGRPATQSIGLARQPAGVFEPSGGFTPRLTTAPSVALTARDRPLPAVIEARHRQRIESARRGMQTARAEERARQQARRLERTSGWEWEGLSDSRVGEEEREDGEWERIGSSELFSSPDVSEQIADDWGPGIIGDSSSDDDTERRPQADGSERADEERGGRGVKEARARMRVPGRSPRELAERREAGGKQPGLGQPHLWPSRDERVLLERWLKLGEEDLEAILDAGNLEVKRMLHQHAARAQALPLHRSAAAADMQEGSGSGASRALKSECFVKIHLLDPTQREGDDKRLMEAAKWIQPADGGTFNPDPFTVQAARTRASFRPTMAASARGRKEFAGLYLPIFAPSKPASRQSPRGVGASDRRSAGTEGPSMPTHREVLGVMALSRDDTEPFSALEEMQVESFCELLGQTLAHRLRVMRADDERSKAACLRDTAMDLAATENSLDALVQRIARAAQELVPSSLARIFLLSHQAECATMYTRTKPGPRGPAAAAAGNSKPSPDVATTRKAEAVPVEQALQFVVESKTTLIVPDVARDARFAGYVRLLDSVLRADAAVALAGVERAEGAALHRAGGASGDGLLGKSSKRVRLASVAEATEGGEDEDRGEGQATPTGFPARTASFTQSPRGSRGNPSSKRPLKKEACVNLISVPLVDQTAQGGEGVVRGILQLVHKFSAAFTDSDKRTLESLAQLGARSIGQALRNAVQRDAQDSELTLLASDNLDQIIEASLGHLRVATGAAVGCCYMHQLGTQGQSGLLVAKGLPHDQSFALPEPAAERDVEEGKEFKEFVVNSCWRRRKVLRVTDHSADKKRILQASTQRGGEGMALALAYWKNLHCSLLFPLLHPESERVLGLLHLSNKADALRKGFDDVDIAKVESIATKLTHALVGRLELAEAQAGQSAARELSRCGTSLFAAQSLANLCQAVARHAPSAFRAQAVRCFLSGPVHLPSGEGGSTQREGMWTSVKGEPRKEGGGENGDGSTGLEVERDDCRTVSIGMPMHALFPHNQLTRQRETRDLVKDPRDEKLRKKQTLGVVLNDLTFGDARAMAGRSDTGRKEGMQPRPPAASRDASGRRSSRDGMRPLGLNESWLTANSRDHLPLLQDMLEGERAAGISLQKAIVQQADTRATGNAAKILVVPLWHPADEAGTSVSRQDSTEDPQARPPNSDRAQARQFMQQSMSLVSRKASQKLCGMLVVRWDASGWLDVGPADPLLRDKLELLQGSVFAAVKRINQHAALQHAIVSCNARLSQHECMETLVTQLAATTTEDQAKSVAQDAAKQLLNCARADVYTATHDHSLLIWHDSDKTKTVNLAQSPDLLLPMSGFVGDAVTAGRPVNVPANATKHPLFVKETDQRSDRCLPQSILVVPLLLEQGAKSLGAIQVTNRLGGGAFDSADEAMLQHLASIAAVCIHNNHRTSRQANLAGALCKVSTSLDVETILRHFIVCVNEWSHGKVLETRVWIRDRRDHADLMLCALAFGTKSKYLKSHLAGAGQGETGLSNARDRPDKCAIKAHTQETTVMPPAPKRGSSVLTDTQCTLYLPLLPSEADGGQSVGVLQMSYAHGALSLSHVELELLGQIGQQCAAALLNSEEHHTETQTQQLYGMLLKDSRPLFRSNTSLAVCEHVCRIGSKLARSTYMSVFTVDREGRHVMNEFSAHGEVSPAVSKCFNLKIKLAIETLHAMEGLAPKSVQKVDADEGEPPKHCCAVLLYKSGVSPTLNVTAAAEGQDKGTGDGKTTVNMALFGVLVALREAEHRSYSQSEVAALQALSSMAAEQMLHISNTAPESTTEDGENQPMRMTAQSVKPSARIDATNSSTDGPTALLPKQVEEAPRVVEVKGNLIGGGDDDSDSEDSQTLAHSELANQKPSETSDRAAPSPLETAGEDMATSALSVQGACGGDDRVSVAQVSTSARLGPVLVDEVTPPATPYEARTGAAGGEGTESDEFEVQVDEDCAAQAHKEERGSRLRARHSAEKRKERRRKCRRSEDELASDDGAADYVVDDVDESTDFEESMMRASVAEPSRS